MEIRWGEREFSDWTDRCLFAVGPSPGQCGGYYLHLFYTSWYIPWETERWKFMKGRGAVMEDQPELTREMYKGMRGVAKEVWKGDKGRMRAEVRIVDMLEEMRFGKLGEDGEDTISSN